MAAAKTKAPKGVGLMIGIGPAEGEPSEGLEGGEEDLGNPSDLAAEGLIKAVKAGDVAGVVAAFRELLAAEDEMEDETEEEIPEELPV